MQLPRLKDLTVLEDHQRGYAEELLEVLSRANNRVLLPQWETRTEL